MLPKKNDFIRNGGVYRQMVRCGKPRCRCTRGEMHEAFYFIRRVSGHQQKLYIPKSKLAEVQEVVDTSRDLLRGVRERLRMSNQWLKSMRDKLREKAESEGLCI